MQEKELSTEEKIKKVAFDLFSRKGFNGTTTRNIADAAGINIAGLHYYYRSKEKLFEIVVGETLCRFTKDMDQVLNSELPLDTKIRKFVASYIDFLQQNPFIALFIISEAHTNTEKLSKMLNDQKSLDTLKSQLKSLADQGIVRDIHPAHFIANMIGLTTFPFVSKPLLMIKAGIDDCDFDRLMEERKQMIPDMIINYLYLNQKQH